MAHPGICQECMTWTPDTNHHRCPPWHDVATEDEFREGTHSRIRAHTRYMAAEDYAELMDRDDWPAWDTWERTIYVRPDCGQAWRVYAVRAHRTVTYTAGHERPA